jgi:FKBP-type peptidyl-prolyl cis-trans isomerase
MNKLSCLKKCGAVLAAAAALTVLAACKGGSAGKNDGADPDANYAMGMFFAQNFQDSGFVFDYDALMQGFKDVAEGRTTRMTEEDAQTKLQTVFLALQEKQLAEQEKQFEGLKQVEADFLTENAKKEGVKTTASGLQYEVVTEGQGARPQASDTVEVNYEGTFINGEIFDSSFVRGEPVIFPLNGVIPGWTEGLQLMSEGSTYRFYVPSELGYGPRGNDRIPPYSPLIFNVEFISIVK